MDYNLDIKDQPAFCFFQIKIMKLRDNPLEIDGQSDTNDPEIMVQLIDISKKIFIDQLSMERQQMALINSTVSHEMRNPLNSL